MNFDSKGISGNVLLYLTLQTNSDLEETKVKCNDLICSQFSDFNRNMQHKHVVHCVIVQCEEIETNNEVSP